MTEQTQMSSKKELGEMIIGYWVSEAIYTVAELGIADLLATGSMTIKELADQTETHKEALYRLMRALASKGIFIENDNGTFSLTPLAENLKSDFSGAESAMARMFGSELRDAWRNLLYSVQTGQGGFQKRFKMSLFEYLTKNPERGEIFDTAMTGIHGGETIPMLDAYDFSQFKTVVDVGGGNGEVLAAILNRHPRVKGILFDLPEVVERTRANISNWGLTDRCQFGSGDFFQAVPSGGSAYLMRHIIHDWPDDKAVSILRNCQQAMAHKGKVLIVESVLPTNNKPHFSKWLDLMMLLIGGKERTAEQYRNLLQEAGLRLSRIVSTSGEEINVIEGVC